MSMPFTTDDVREHVSPPTNGWLPARDMIKMCDEIDRLRATIANVRWVREFYPNQSDVPWKDIQRALDAAPY